LQGILHLRLVGMITDRDITIPRGDHLETTLLDALREKLDLTGSKIPGRLASPRRKMILTTPPFGVR
jgi:hypothetical protein